MTKSSLGSGVRQGFVGMTAAMALTLTACGEAEVVEAPAEDVIDGITIENARMVLAPVSGNPAAIYFDFAYAGDRSFSLGRVAVGGAESAVIHTYSSWNLEMQMMEAGPIPVTDGTEVAFTPGELHIMAMEVSPEIAPGSTTEVTLTVSGGDKHTFEAEVRAAGEER